MLNTEYCIATDSTNQTCENCSRMTSTCKPAEHRIVHLPFIAYPVREFCQRHVTFPSRPSNRLVCPRSGLTAVLYCQGRPACRTPYHPSDSLKVIAFLVDKAQARSQTAQCAWRLRQEETWPHWAVSPARNFHIWKLLKSPTVSTNI